VTERAAVSRAVARLVCASAGAFALASGCEPQDIYLFDGAAPRADAGASEPEPSEPDPDRETDDDADDDDAATSARPDAAPPRSEQPRCLSAACQTCVAESRCAAPGAQLFCHPQSGACLLACDSAAVPPVGCPASQHCDPAVGLCVACASESDCGGAVPVCDERVGICVECASGVDCPATSPVCDAETSRCVQCLGDANCRGFEEDLRCLPAEQRCVECVVDADCVFDPRKPFCKSEHECDDSIDD
jgi:hypothetical protein